MIIGIDLGGMSAKAAILTQTGLMGKSRTETSATVAPHETAEALARLCKAVAEKAGKDFGEVRAIGIGSPGGIDSGTGTVVHWSNYGWTNVPLGEYVRQLTGKPTFVLNDANAAALGEAKYGAGKQYDDSMMITIGTGIGGGIIVGGKLLEGYRGVGGEPGHTVIRQGGELCTCGRRGCYERYASASALIRLTKAAMEECRESALWKFATLDTVDARTVFFAMKENDETAKRVFSEYIAALGEGITDFVNLLRPQAVILGGGISAEGETLLAPLREYVIPRLMVPVDYAPLAIVCATLGNDAGIYGAAEYASTRI